MAQLDELGFSIPLLEDAGNLANMLLGNDVDLFTWTMPEMGIESEFSRSFPIWGPLSGNLNGAFSTDINLSFGFDTSGYSEWRETGFDPSEFYKAFNGFYINDRNDEGVDIPEFTLDSSLGAGLGASAGVVRGTVSGGLMAQTSLDLLDEGEISGTDDGRIYGDEFANVITNPLDMFELIGSLSAFLSAKVEAGIDVGAFSIMETVWEDNLATIPIFEFGVGGTFGSGSVNNGKLVNSTVFYDANFNGRIDESEPYFSPGSDSSFSLRIDHRSFDDNNNGRLSLKEGRLMSFGGYDPTTGFNYTMPLLGAVNGVITPLTSVKALLIENDYTGRDFKRLMYELFSLSNFNFRNSDPSSALQVKDSISTPNLANYGKAYLAHTKLMLPLQFLSEILKEMSPDYGIEIADDLALFKEFASNLIKKRSIPQALKKTALAFSYLFANDENNSDLTDQSYKSTIISDNIYLYAIKILDEVDQVGSCLLESDIKASQFYASMNKFKRRLHAKLADISSGLAHNLYKKTDQPSALSSRFKSSLDSLTGISFGKRDCINFATKDSLSSRSYREILSNDSLPLLRNYQFKNIPKDMISSIDASDLDGLTSDQLDSFSSRQLNSIPIQVYESLSESTLSLFSSDFICKLDSDRYKAIYTSDSGQISSL